jgi:hypothetical protein
MNSSQDFHWVAATPTAGTQAGLPIADFAAGNTISDVVCMSKYHTAYFIVYWGATTGGTETLTLTIVPCSDATGGTTTTAIPFLYKRVSSGDTNAAWVAASTVTCTAGHRQMYILRVDADDLPLVSGVKYEYCYCNIAEVINDPCLGGCLIMMADPRYAEDTTDTVTA